MAIVGLTLNSEHLILCSFVIFLTLGKNPSLCAEINPVASTVCYDYVSGIAAEWQSKPFRLLFLP